VCPLLGALSWNYVTCSPSALTVIVDADCANGRLKRFNGLSDSSLRGALTKRLIEFRVGLCTSRLETRIKESTVSASVSGISLFKQRSPRSFHGRLARAHHVFTYGVCLSFLNMTRSECETLLCFSQTRLPKGCHNPRSRDRTQHPLDRVLSSSIDSGTRKVVSYTLQQ